MSKYLHVKEKAMEVRNMKTKTKLKNIEIYKAKMEGFEFMWEYLNDVPEIFDTSTMKCRLFLIKSFTVLNANFHYLSLLTNDAIDQELLNAACILQIYPFRPNQEHGLFLDMNDLDVHKFWMRFFKQCEVHKATSEESSDDVDSLDLKPHQSLFSDISTTSQYFSYDFSIVNKEKIKDIDVDKEINSWSGISRVRTTIGNNVLDNSQKTNIVDTNNMNFDINRLMSDVKYIKKRIDCRGITILKPLYFQKDFFCDFISAVKEISAFRQNMNYIGSFVLENVFNNMSLYNGCFFPLNIHQIENIDDIVQDDMLMMILNQTKQFKHWRKIKNY